MSRFSFDAQASRVVFGSGAILSIRDEIARLGRERAFLVSTPGRSTTASQVAGLLGDCLAGTFANAQVHVPKAIAIAGRNAAEAAHADCIVAAGGGSAIGVAKAIALTLPVPIVAVPTTYGGSEMTPVWGLTDGGTKQTGRDSRVQPRVVIYDPDLTLSLPSRTTACSGLNAMAHCIEALYARDANSLTSSAALTGLRLLAQSLPVLARSPADASGRADALEGAWLAGFALGTAGMGLHHKLCHTLGGSFMLPHAETHAVLLPYTAAYNRDSAAAALSSAAAALGASDAPTALGALAATIGAPLTLKAIGFREADIELAAELASKNEYPNPRPVTVHGMGDLLHAAYNGDAGYYVTL